MMRALASALIGLFALAMAGCGLVTRNDQAVFVLVDVSGTYFAEVDDAVRGSKLITASLNAGDQISVAEIGSCSFDDDALALNTRLPDRPSEAAAAKTRALSELDAYEARAQRTQYTDIHGAMLQAVDRLSRSGATKRVIVVFSDLVEDPVSGCESAQAPLDLDGVTVIAANVIKLTADARAPQQYFDRLDAWETMVTEAGGTWRLVDDVEGLRAAVSGA